MSAVRLQEIVVDCADPAALAAFWAQVLGVRWASVDAAWAVVDAGPVLLAFQRVPEPKASPKNRLHLDIEVPDARAALARAEQLGAQRTGQCELGPRGDGYIVLRDPELNEFCFVQDSAGDWQRQMRDALDAAPPAAG